MTFLSNLAESSSNKEELINNNYRLTEAIAFYGVIDNTLTAPPNSPSSLGLYIPAENSTGAWSGLDNKLLWYDPLLSLYLIIEPVTNLKVNSLLGDSVLRFNGTTWDTFNYTENGTTESGNQGNDILNHPTLSNGLIAYYAMEESGGNPRIDSVGSYDLALNGLGGDLSSQSGIIGNESVFTGGTSYFESSGLATALGTDTSFSVSCWASVTDTVANRAIISQWRDTIPETKWALFYRVSTNVWSVNESGLGNLESNVTPIPNQRYHLVYVYDATATTSYIYIDGLLNNSRSTALPSNTPLVTVGERNGSNHNGSIDEIAIYNRVLTASEVSDLYNSGNGLPYNQPAIFISNHPTLTNGLIAYYQLEESSGTRSDSVGSYDLTVVGNDSDITSQTGIIGSEAVFNSSTSHLSNTSISTALSNSDFSISLWVSLADLSTNQQIASIWNSAPNREFTLYYNQSSNEFAVSESSTGSDGSNLLSGIAPTLNQKYHLVYSHNFTTNFSEFYVDGVLTSSQTVVLNYENNPFRLGATDTQYFQGTVDEVAIYNRVLTSQEVSNLYNSGDGLPLFTPLRLIVNHPTLTNGLIAYYSLEEATGDFLDSTNNGNDLTRSTNGTTQTTGKIDNALETTSGQLGKAFNPNFNPFYDTDWSVSLWFNFKRDGSPAGNQSFIGLTQIGSANGVNIRTNSPTAINARIGGVIFDSPTPNTIALNTWYYLTVTFDKTTFETKLYFDGALINTQTTGTIPNITTRGLSIGAQDHENNETGRHSDALFDEIAIYNRVLTSQEVGDLYNSGNGLAYFVSYNWSFEDTLNDRIQNLSFTRNAETSGMPFVTSSNGKAIAGDASNDKNAYLQASLDTNLFNFNKNTKISFIVNPTNTAYTSYLSFSTSSSNARILFDNGNISGSTDRLRLIIFEANNNRNDFDSTALTYNQPYRIELQKNDSNFTYSIYDASTNNLEFTQTQNIASDFTASDWQLLIGSNSSGNSLSASDYIDEVSLTISPYNPNAVLLLPGNDYTDDSPSNHPVTVNGSVPIVNNAFSFNGSTANYLSLPDSSDWDLGSSDFSVTMDVNLNSAPPTVVILLSRWRWGNNNDLCFNFWFNLDNTLRVSYSTTGSNFPTVIGNLPDTNYVGNFKTVGFERIGENINILYDGQIIGTSNVGTISFHDSSRNLYIGYDGDTTDSVPGAFNGLMKNIQIAKV